MSHGHVTARISVPTGDGEWLIVSADPEALRSQFTDDLRRDGMYDAPDDALVKFVYEQAPDHFLFTVTADE